MTLGRSPATMRARDLLATYWSLVGRDHEAGSIPLFEEALVVATAVGDRGAEIQASLGEAYTRTFAAPEGGALGSRRCSIA
jgi:hypothetical protein